MDDRQRRFDNVPVEFHSLEEAIQRCIDEQGAFDHAANVAVAELRKRGATIPHVGVFTDMSFSLGRTSTEETYQGGLLSMSEAGVVYVLPVFKTFGRAVKNIRMLEIHGSEIVNFRSPVGTYIDVDWVLNGQAPRKLELHPTRSATARLGEIFSCLQEIEDYWAGLGR